MILFVLDSECFLHYLTRPTSRIISKRSVLSTELQSNIIMLMDMEEDIMVVPSLEASLEDILLEDSFIGVPVAVQR